MVDDDACDDDCASPRILANSTATSAPTRALFSISLTSARQPPLLAMERRSHTQLEGLSARELSHAFQQPRSDFLAPLVDTLLDALPHSHLDGPLYLVTCRSVLSRDRHREQRAK